MRTKARMVVARRAREKGEEGEREKTRTDREEPERGTAVGKVRLVAGETGWRVMEEGRMRVRMRWLRRVVLPARARWRSVGGEEGV